MDDFEQASCELEDVLMECCIMLPLYSENGKLDQVREIWHKAADFRDGPMKIIEANIVRLNGLHAIIYVQGAPFPSAHAAAVRVIDSLIVGVAIMGENTKGDETARVICNEVKHTLHWIANYEKIHDEDYDLSDLTCVLQKERGMMLAKYPPQEFETEPVKLEDLKAIVDAIAKLGPESTAKAILSEASIKRGTALAILRRLELMGTYRGHSRKSRKNQ